MPTISKGDLVLVTGASGFIAVHLVRDLLNEGYRVRGTVRSNEKGDYLKDLFKGQDFEYVIVDDITKDGIFDEAVKGVDAIAHTASPFHFNITHPDQLIEPAFKGTTGILKSMQKNNPNVKRIVITSSMASVMSPISDPQGCTLTEKDWNKDSLKQVEEKGKDTDPTHSYRASKTKAERSLWEFIEKEKPTWDAAAICPPFVFGEILQQCDKKDSLNTSVATFLQWANGSKKEDDLPGPMGSWVSVKDVSLAHVRALEVPEAGGERFIVGAGKVAGQDLVDAIHERFPDLKNVPVGKQGAGPESTKDVALASGAKATKVLGIKYQSLADCVSDMGKSLQKKGWL